MLTQSEVDALIAMQKKRTENAIYDFPNTNSILSIPISSVNDKETFLIDINRKGTVRLKKCSYQERFQMIHILVRLDVDGPPHPNPETEFVPLPYLHPYNGQTIQCPHLHLYVEGFMDRWAIPAPSDKFTTVNDLYATLCDFFRYCNIVEPPRIQKGLFS